jgi:hypothetical protein
MGQQLDVTCTQPHHAAVDVTHADELVANRKSRQLGPVARVALTPGGLQVSSWTILAVINSNVLNAE